MERTIQSAKKCGEIAKSESERQAWVASLLTQTYVHSALVMALEKLARQIYLEKEGRKKNLY